MTYGEEEIRNAYRTVVSENDCGDSECIEDALICSLLGHNPLDGHPCDVCDPPYEGN